MKIVYSNEDNMKGGAKLKGIDKTHYLLECHDLLTENHRISRDHLLTYLKNDAVEAIDKLYPTKAEQLKADLEIIFNSIEDIPASMTNHLFIYNVVCLQVAVLFTYASIDFAPVTPETVEHYGLNGQGDWFNEFTNVQGTDFGYAGNPDANWREWNHVLKTQRLDVYKENFLIIVLDYLTIDEVVLPYLDGKFLCGLTYGKTYADNLHLVPFFFVAHDRVHASNYLYYCPGACGRSGRTMQDLRHFYSMISRISNVRKQRAAKTMFFLQIHEDVCRVFDANIHTVDSIRNPNSEYWNGPLRLDRFMNDNDLGLLIPKEDRATEEARIRYLEYAIKLYSQLLAQYSELIAQYFAESTGIGGISMPKKRRRTKTRKNKKRSRQSRK